jgi:flagellar hook-associated protein 2
MATISSAGIGSGLDVNSIVTQLVAVEKTPLKALASQATLVQAQITAFGTIQSQFSALSDVATRIAAGSAWVARSASSSSAAATISASASAAATSFTLDVDALASKQSASSAQIAAGSAVGAGTLNFSLGTWSGIAASTAADATTAAKDAAVAATSAGATAMSQVNAVKTALASFAGVNTAAAPYSTAYTNWANAVAANDHLTPSLITAESDALTARNTAYSALGGAAPATQSAADILAANATAGANLAAFAVDSTSASASLSTTADYANKYTTWAAAVAANDHSTPALISAQATAQTALDTAYGNLGATDKASVDTLTAATTTAISAADTALTAFATGTPSVAAYATQYHVWAAAVIGKDPVAAASAQTDLDTAYAALSPADKQLVKGFTAAATAAPTTAAISVASFAVGSTATTSIYSSKYTAWVNAVAANDGVTQTLIDAQATALTALNTAHAKLSATDTTTVDGITTAAASSTATASVAAWKLAADASTAASNPRATFAAASTGSFSVAVTASDTVTTLAAKINAANGGVVATTFNDGTYDRLLLSSKNTGVAGGFRVQASGSGDGTNFDDKGLSRLAYDPHTGSFGMASVGLAATQTQGADAKARINGMAVTSGSNTLASNIPGVTINLVSTTTPTSQVTMSVSEDVTPAVKNVQDFVTAYNALSASLADLTKYDSATKTASLFQGDSSVLGLQSVLRSMVGSTSSGSSVYKRLSDVGLELQRDGSLTLNTSKLATAANNGTELQKMFTTNNSNTLTNGFGIKFRDLAHGVLATGGSVVNKATALQNALTRNTAEQTKVNDRAAAFETRLRKQYSALDAQMASLTALNAYVSQQVTTWNKSTA